MCKAFRKIGNEVYLYAVSRGEGNCDFDTPMKVIDSYRARIPGRDLRIVLSNRRLYRSWKKEIMPGSDVDMIYERYSLYGFAGSKLTRFAHVPFILEVNSPLATKHRKRLHFPRLALMAEKMILRQADAIVCVSENLMDKLIAKGIDRDKIYVIPLGVDPEKFNYRTSGERIVEAYNLKDKIVVGFVGLLRKVAGVDYVIESARTVIQRFGNVHFLIVGEGRRKQDLRNYIKKVGLSDCVTLVGGIPHAEVPEYVAAMDIALAPYTYQAVFHNSPMKLFEYLYMAKPVIASDMGQISDVITNGDNGILVPPSDTNALIDAICLLVENEKDRNRMGINARKSMENHYTWIGKARKIIEIYHHIVENRTE
jgi:glycosyltransferase involved in cell wall biosynthesis